jgi:ketosteroid isomerase-like protein
MKYLGTIFLILLVTTAFSQKAKNKSKSTDEVAKVKAMIEQETKAFFEIDYDTWADCWAHVPYAYWSFADTTDVNFFDGWESIKEGFGNYFATSKPTKAKISRNWHEVRVNGNLAYARFSQKIDDNIERDSQAEVRVLEKIDGKWKILHVGVIARQKRQN